MQPIKDLKKINYSSDRFYEFFNGGLEVVPPTSFPSYVSVGSDQRKRERRLITGGWWLLRSTSVISPRLTSKP